MSSTDGTEAMPVLFPSIDSLSQTIDVCLTSPDLFLAPFDEFLKLICLQQPAIHPQFHQAPAIETVATISVVKVEGLLRHFCLNSRTNLSSADDVNSRHRSSIPAADQLRKRNARYAPYHKYLGDSYQPGACYSQNPLASAM